MILSYIQRQTFSYMHTHSSLLILLHITWRKIYNRFMEENFVEDLVEVHAYINIKNSMMRRIRCRCQVMPCVEVIEQIIAHMDDSNLVLHSESGGQLAMNYGEDMHTYYKMLMPTKYEYTDFSHKSTNTDTRDIIRSQCRDRIVFFHHPSIFYPTKFRRDMYQCLIALYYLLNECKNAKVFEENWIYIYTRYSGDTWQRF